MKAVIWTKYGAPDNLQLQVVETPTPNEDQILVKIHATSVTAGDCEMRRLQLPLGLSLPMRFYAGFMKPKRITILGQELAGEVVEVGKDVDNYQKGDRVFGTTGFSFGANAEYIVLPARPDDAQGVLALKPDSVSFEEAAVLPTAGFEALHYFSNSHTQPGDKVLIVGGGGSIGTIAIQLAKIHGAEVTAVDSTDKQDLLRSLGADHVIDYTTTDYLKQNDRYNLIIDVVGRKGVRRRLKLLKPGGMYYLAFARPAQLLLALWISLTSRRKLIIQSAGQKKSDLEHLARLLSEGKLKTVIDKHYPLEEVPAAHKYSESGRKKGNLTISII
jgi:2-desacetyl-2-hydroxyethyl bacteriochlorophyllide A dehydrogenase